MSLGNCNRGGCNDDLYQQLDNSKNDTSSSKLGILNLSFSMKDESTVSFPENRMAIRK